MVKAQRCNSLFHTDAIVMQFYAQDTEILHMNLRSETEWSVSSAGRKYLFATPMSRDHTKRCHVHFEEGSCCDSLWKAVFAPKMALEDELRDQYN